MIAPVVVSVLAAVVIGSGPGVDCKVSNALTQATVPNRAIIRTAPGFADDPEALKNVLSTRLKTPLNVLTITKIGADAFIVDWKPSKIPDLTFFKVLSGDDRFSYAGPDPYIYSHGAVDTNDFYFHSTLNPLWGLRAIRAPEAWASCTGSAAVVVAVVDGGISPDHEDLTPLWRSPTPVDDCAAGFSGYDAIENKCQIQVRGPHATEMAGTIGAHAGNGVGVVGVNWTVSLLSSSFTDNGVGCASAAVNALHFVTRAVESKVNVRVVNMSWGTSTDEPTILTELQALSKHNVVFVASAGNDGDDLDSPGKKMYPASYPLDALISVAATNEDLALIDDSNRGATAVHIAAPGESIVTTSLPALPLPSTYNFYTTGTSIAAAHVTGAIALLAAKCPGLTAKQLKDVVLTNSRQNVPALKGVVAKGRFLDVAAAMDAATKMEACKALQ